MHLYAYVQDVRVCADGLVMTPPISAAALNANGGMGQ